MPAGTIASQASRLEWRHAVAAITLNARERARYRGYLDALFES